ncbi:succinate dehydrogenase assembly factor 2 [Sphingopyxis sp. J-6]|uniref:succinate dehydrogenase assembly factor 2 n=1 Tax=Sphingopyxis sp. J-6 TaxID=3122054 RepID=UPI0039840B5F
MPHTDRLKRLKFRAWHRGTREADYMIGGFFDRYSPEWGEAEIAWYEIVVEEDDVDIMAWALGTGHPPVHLDNPPLIAAMRRLDYIPLP